VFPSTDGDYWNLLSQASYVKSIWITIALR